MNNSPAVPGRRESAVLLLSVFIVATCAIFYELLIGTVSSYFLGSSITQFSFTIGLFMFFMGVGAYLSKYITRELLSLFVAIEVLIGLIGGFSALVLYGAFSLTRFYYVAAVVLIASLSTLIGLEIPLVMRIAQQWQSLKDALANMLAFDYLGALFASVLFPLVLLPYLGLMKTAFFVGLLNTAIALVNVWEFRALLCNARRLGAYAVCSFLLLGAGFAQSFRLSSLMESILYEDEIIYAAQTPYQRLILTRYKEDTRLYINGELQFSSADEYRYHEPLVHVPLALAPNRSKVLILGGGDGLAVREVLKYDDAASITIVDIDSEMLRIATEHTALRELNGSALSNPRVHAVAEDAYKFVEETNERFSVVIIDLPDPNDHGLAKLYSREFYALLRRIMSADGVVVTQSTSPIFARRAFWCIHETLRAEFPHVIPYTAYVPSFGQWGFNMASSIRLDPAHIKLTVPTRFLSSAVLPTLFVLDADMERITVERNNLGNQILLHYYEKSWDEWN